MTDSSFRSRYAGMPGSLVAIRVDYARRTAAFDGVPAESSVAHAKREVKRWKMGHRLGDKAEWNTSNQPEGYVGDAPIRPNLRQLSEYQGTRIEYNYRASVLPDINHKTRFVPDPSKLQVDRSIFLPQREREMLVGHNMGTAAHLSRHELTNAGMPGYDRESGWKASVALDGERTDIYRLRDYEDFRDINKTKDVLDHSKYVSPLRRQVATMKASREDKLLQREEEARARSLREMARHPHSAPHVASSERTFKMSNINEWWDDAFDSKMVAAASTVLGRPVRIDGLASASNSVNGAVGGADLATGDANDP